MAQFYVASVAAVRDGVLHGGPLRFDNAMMVVVIGKKIVLILTYGAKCFSLIVHG